MTKAIRNAAQALLDSNDRGEGCARRDLEGALRVALAAPASTDDERVAEHILAVRHVTEAGMPEIVQRVLRFAGKERREVSNPNITAREAIKLADWMRDAQAAIAALQARINALEAGCREEYASFLLQEAGRCPHGSPVRVTLESLAGVVRLYGPSLPQPDTSKEAP